MRSLVASSIVIASLAAAGGLDAQALDSIRVGDLAGTGGAWQSGEVTVPAPAVEVQKWLADTTDWKARFPDIDWVQALGATADGRDIIRFRSRIIGRPITLRMRNRPGLITYEGDGKDVNVQGRIYVQAMAAGATHVTIQTTSALHGIAGAFASRTMRRDRAIEKLRADLGALTQLAHTYATARRSGG